MFLLGKCPQCTQHVPTEIQVPLPPVTRVDCEDNRAVGVIVNGTKSRRIRDCDFQIFEGFQLRGPKVKNFVLVSEINEGTSNEGISFDEDAQNSAGTKKGANFRDVHWNRPVLSSLDSRVISDPAFIVADVPENIHLRNSNDTGGKGEFTQQVHCEFFVSPETICLVVTQQVCGGFF
jgi:hypothetical protein